MATEVGSAYLTILPSGKGFGKKLSGDIDPQMGTAGKSAGSKFGSGLGSSAKGIGSKAGLLIGGALVAGVGIAIGGIGAILKTGFDESKDASAGTAQLAAGIKSTGNAAHVSVKGLNALASAVQGYSGQTDDSIVASEQLLLTFTNIKNGPGGDIFDRATQSTADMAAKMGGDASGAAIQLGKALNDPVKGITALSRVGVSFTKGQKDSIAAMMKHGDVAGAQNIILKELQTEFGGAALAAGKSLPGQMAIAKRSFEDLSQTVVGGLLPAFTTGLSGINSFVQGTKASFEKGGLSQVFTDLGAKITAALPGIQAQLGKWGVAFWAWIQKATPPMLVKLGELWVKLETWIWGTALPAIAAKLVSWGKAFVAWIAPMIPPALVALGGLLTRVGNWIWHTGFPLLQGQLAKWGKAFWAWVVPAIGPLLGTLGGMLLRLLGWVVTVALPAIGFQLRNWGLAFVKWVVPMIPPMLLELAKLLGKLGVWLLTTALPALIGKLAQWGQAFWKWIPGAALKMVVEFGKLLARLTIWFVTTAIPKIVGFIAGLPSRIASASAGMWDGLKTSFRSAINWIIGKWNDFRFTIGGGSVMGVAIPSVTLDTPNIPMLAAGGIVPATPGGRLVRVAEGGRDEAIVPLGKGAGGLGGAISVYVQNPFTGEYLLGKVSNVVDGHTQSLVDTLVYGGS